VSIIEPRAINTDVASRNMFLPKKIIEQQQPQQQLPSPPMQEEEEKSKEDNNMMPIIISSSPFAEMVKVIMEKSKAAVANGSHPKLVAEMVVRIYEIEKPEWRYLAGDYSEKLFEARRQMTDSEFEKFLYRLFSS
jgi:hypothetical protein